MSEQRKGLFRVAKSFAFGFFFHIILYEHSNHIELKTVSILVAL